jgi:hypothetical protein
VTEQSTGELSARRGLFVDKFVRGSVQLHRTQSLRPRPISARQHLSFADQQGRRSSALPSPISGSAAVRRVRHLQDHHLLPAGELSGRYDGGSEFRIGFPTSEYGSVGLRYTFSIDIISPFGGAPTVIQQAAGSFTTSSVGYSYSYNTLDDPIKPRHGLHVPVQPGFRGLRRQREIHPHGSNHSRGIIRSSGTIRWWQRFP